MNRFFRYHLDHVLFWLLTLGFHAYTRLHLIDKANVFQFALEVVVRNALLAGVIYFNLLFVIPRWSNRRLPVWLLASAGSVVVYVFAKNLHDVYLYRYVIGDVERSGFLHNTFYNFSIALFYLAFSCALYLSKQWYVQRELLRQIRIEKLNTELEYLKAQMNPHFLFNSLNTIFFQIDKQNTLARETLGKFSDMLRYQLYECNGNHITIEKELAYLTNYVELQKLRRNHRDRIEFKFSDGLKDFTLPPLLFIPFVENAFKHMSNFTEKQNEITIDLTRNGHSVKLTVTNTTDDTGQKNGGIGLKNVTRRLELLFPDRHILQIKQTPGWFDVQLTLVLHEN